MDAQTTFDTLVNFLQKGKKDKAYDKRVEISEWNTSMLTGENQGQFLDKIRSKESKAQQEQRRRVTVSRTPFPSNKVLRIYDGVEQANNYFEEIKTKSADDLEKRSVAAFMKALDVTNKIGLKKYIFSAVKVRNFYDPNAYLILESKDELDNIKVLPSSSVLKTNTYQHDLEYIIFTTENDTFYVYSKSSYYALKRIKDEEVADYQDQYEVITIAEGSHSGKYAMIDFNTEMNLSRCPAICVGHILDPVSTDKVYHSPLNVANKLFQDLMQDKSEYDVAKAVHGFLKKYAYVPKCNYKRKVDGHTSSCSNGYLSADDSECPACKGTGVSLHFSQQDIILFKISNLSEMQKIGDLTHYESIPMDFVKANREDFMQWERDILEIVFNGDQQDQKAITSTATEKLLDQQGIHAKFVEYSNKLSEVIRFFTNLLAEVYGVSELIDYSFGFSNDFHLESLDDLLKMRKDSVDAGASNHVIKLIDSKILMKMSQGDTNLVKKINARESFRPFRYSSLEDKAMIFQSIDLQSKEYIRYLYFDQIMDKVEQQQINLSKDSEEGVIEFHQLNPDRQEELIDQIQQEYYPVNATTEEDDRAGVEGSGGV